MRNFLGQLRKWRTPQAILHLAYRKRRRYLLQNSSRTQLYLHGFWPGADDDARLIELLRDLLCRRAEGYREVCVASVFADPPRERSNGTLYVQFSGESRYHDPKLFDVNLIPAAQGKGVVTLPYMAFEYWKRPELDRLCRSREITQTEFERRRPCLFVVSNPASEPRIRFFERLNEILPVDSWGAVLNNQGGGRPAGNWWEPQYLQFISRYRFMICFENTRSDYYLTEKLLNAYAGGAIPIYWGCPQLASWINPTALLRLQSEFSAEAAEGLVQDVLKLNASFERYQAVHAEPLFLKTGTADPFDMQRFIALINACQ